MLWGVAGLVGTWLRSRESLSGERGASAVEYGLLVALIAAVIIAVVTILGGNVNSLYDSTATNYP